MVAMSNLSKNACCATEEDTSCPLPLEKVSLAMLQKLQNNDASALETLLRKLEAMSNQHAVEALLVETREMEVKILREIEEPDEHSEPKTPDDWTCQHMKKMI